MVQCRNWPKTVLQPSFKGVPFEIDEATEGGGRRIVTHEYPSREYWDNEDLGRALRTRQVQGFVYGDDADGRALRLQEALSSEGPGSLVLSVPPVLQARCTSWSSTFESAAMGRVSFEMQFVVEAEHAGGLVPSTQLGIAVHNAAKTVAGTIGDVFSAAFDTLKRRFDSSPVRVPSLARDAAAVTIARAATALDGARRKVAGSDAVGAAKLEFAARDIRARARDLAYAGQIGSRVEPDTYVADERIVANGFAGTWRSAMDMLLDIRGIPSGVADAFYSLAAFQPQVIFPNLDTLSTRAERALTGEVGFYVRRTALVYWTAALAKVSFATTDDAAAMRAQVTGAFLTGTADITDKDLIEAMAGVRNKAIDFLGRTSSQLPATVTVDCGRPLPAAVIAHALYGDASRDAEIFARNAGAGAHPLFMPPVVEAVAPSVRVPT
jgi:hypothetical protein